MLAQTYIGHVLISVNPYRKIKGMYADQLLKDYRGKYRYELPPHVFSLADDMYRSMMSEGENQCVIIRCVAPFGSVVDGELTAAVQWREWCGQDGGVEACAAVHCCGERQQP